MINDQDELFEETKFDSKTIIGQAILTSRLNSGLMCLCLAVTIGLRDTIIQT